VNFSFSGRMVLISARRKKLYVSYLLLL